MTKKSPKSDTKNPGRKRPGMIASIRNHFFTGVVVALPIGLTIWMISAFVRKVDKLVKPILPPEMNPDTYLQFHIPGVGLLVSLVALWMLGVLATNFFGSRLLRLGENLVARVPVVRNIYNFLKQIVGVVANQKDTAFKEVCLIEYPRPGLWAIGFITSDLRGAPLDHLPEGHVCVFVPTTPNPTSGFLLFAKREELKILDMTPEEGAKMIISSGMVASNEDMDALSEE